MAVRILLGDTRPESRGVLQPLCDEQGWQLLAVESSFQVLRMIRDTSEIGLVLINPALPGSGVSGRDVARTIKASAQYGALPVMFVLHAGDTAPEGLSVNGVLEIGRSSPGRLLESMRTVMGIGAGDEHPTPADHALVADAPRAPATAGAAALKAVEPLPAEPAVARRSARIIVADTVETSRSVLQPLFERQGWELIAAESGFQVLRSVRDTDVDLVLINPYLHASGVSGADIARTIKGAAQFRKLPVLFLVHPGQAPPQGGIADGAIEVDGWPAERIMRALNTAMDGGPADATVEDTMANGSPTMLAPPAVEPREPAAGEPAAPPTARSAPVSIPAEQIAQLRDEMLGEVRHAVDTALRGFVQTEGSTGVEDALRRLEQHEQTLAEMADEIAEARRALDAISGEPDAEIGRRDAIQAAVREYVLVEGRSLAEQLVTEAARAIVPAVAESLVQRHLEQAPNPASVIDELLPELRERLLEDARHTADVVRPADADVRGAMEDAIHQYVAGEGRSAVEQVITAVAREIVPVVAERLIRDEIARLRREYRLD